MHNGIQIPKTIAKTLTPVLLVRELAAQQPPLQHTSEALLHTTEGALLMGQHIFVLLSIQAELQHV